MLVAGASALYPSAYGGAFTFVMNGLPLDAWWDYGSAYNYDMPFAGASAFNPLPLGGTLLFDVAGPPSWANWDAGSAIYR